MCPVYESDCTHISDSGVGLFKRDNVGLNDRSDADFIDTDSYICVNL